MTDRIQRLRKFFVEEHRHREQRSKPCDPFRLAAASARYSLSFGRAMTFGLRSALMVRSIMPTALEGRPPSWTRSS